MIFVFRVPFFGKRVCDGNFTRHDFVKGVQELCAANSTDPAAFVDAVGEALYDQYEFQKLTKKISSGELKIFKFYVCEAHMILFRKCHLYYSLDKACA